MDFVRFTGEWVVYMALIALGGGVLVGLAAGMFNAIGRDPETMLGEWVVPMGASGDHRSPHHLDQLAAWAEARLLPVELEWDRLTFWGDSADIVG